MFNALLKLLFGSHNQRLIKSMQKKVAEINALEPKYQQLSDAELQSNTLQFRERIAKGATLEEILPEAFATVREASKRTLGLRHFDVQLIGGMTLHQGKIAEMHTGEGKTLVATLAAYLNALSGKGVHVVTVNDYLAQRDAEWMSPIYEFLGLKVGVNLPRLDRTLKQEAYQADITYGTNNEFGFDYLRDNMAFSAKDQVQRGLNFAIVDEVDSILIDEARTPLIISGPAEDSSDLYRRINEIIHQLKKQKAENPDNTNPEINTESGDFTIDEQSRHVFLTEYGHQHAEEILHAAGLLAPDTGLYDSVNISILHHLLAALRAHNLFQRDVQYIVRNNEVIIVDEHTGRTMQGRRWSDGLHQAIEAKEGVKIQQENQTLASITFQNYFRLYQKLSGMTGTADTEAYEFKHIYNLEVVVIPSNKPKKRQDLADLVFLTEKEKYDAVIKDIRECRERQQPILVGTASIETSEYLADVLNKEKIPHQVLNAKQHEREAHVIAEAGRPGAVTIATNMAGRGTDIVLGGNLEMELATARAQKEGGLSAEEEQKLRDDWKIHHEQVLTAGGLHVIGSERHESRRIDNQLRGRSGRQGDPGSSRFYLSLEDSLMRIFASPRLASMMQKLGMEEGEAIESKMVSRAIENAQRKVEGRNFDIRKQLLEFDDVANDQRRVIYELRNKLMHAEQVSDNIVTLRQKVINVLVERYVPPQSLIEQWDLDSLQTALERDFNLTTINIRDWLAKEPSLNAAAIQQRVLDEILANYQQRHENVPESVIQQLEKVIMLQQLDQHWKEHLGMMDYLRQSVGLRGYAQKDPKQEYKREAFDLFQEMIARLEYQIISMLTNARAAPAQEVQELEERRQQTLPDKLVLQHDAAMNVLTGQPEEDAEVVARAEKVEQRVAPKVGRNDPCPCGSGKKYKQCHGKLD
ncbi:MAG: preprotein translocase subunit SecA [Gammaproteobacteria bacterium]